MKWLVDAVELLALLLVAPVLLYRAWRTGKYRRDWDQRRGWISIPPPDPRRPRVWVHAVSVGEVNAVRGLIAAWQQRGPELDFVISATTDTGIDRARQIYPHCRVIRYPLDLSRFVRRALDAVQPSLIVLVELEVWYQFITTARERGIPVAIVNGRLTEKSARRFGWIAPVSRRMFGALSWVGAQDETYAARFRAAGVPAERVTVTGSLKWDTAEVADTIAGADALARAMGIRQDRPVWVCGSTADPEHALALSVLKNHPELQLVMVPRKPEWFQGVADLVAKQGFECVRRSACPDGTTRPPSERAVFLVDTMGELRKVYSLADLVFVGRTIAPLGGSDMMEVAGLARPIIIGPHTENFADVVQRLRAADAVCETRADYTSIPVAYGDLARAVERLLSDPAAARQMGQRGREVVLQNRGATGRTLEHLNRLLPLSEAVRA